MSCCKWMLIVTGLFNIAVNDFDAKECAGYNCMVVVTELVVSGTQYMFIAKAAFKVEIFGIQKLCF